jgi:predicted DNA binding protein
VELGISMADLARKLGVTLSAVSYAVRRGEKEAKLGYLNLED